MTTVAEKISEHLNDQTKNVKGHCELMKLESENGNMKLRHLMERKFMEQDSKLSGIEKVVKEEGIVQMQVGGLGFGRVLATNADFSSSDFDVLKWEARWECRGHGFEGRVTLLRARERSQVGVFVSLGFLVRVTLEGCWHLILRWEDLCRNRFKFLQMHGKYRIWLLTSLVNGIDAHSFAGLKGHG
ncbi:hypothetical protein Dimus_003454 [Dionaea muscipula]